MSQEPYPEDEFDEIGRNLPKGAHRPAPPWWQGVLPFLVVLIVAPLLGWIVFLAIGWQAPADNTAGKAKPSASASATPKKTAQPSKTPSETPSATPSETPSQTPSAPAVPSKDITVQVANASGVGGMAGRSRDEIAKSGYQDVTALNYQGSAPAQNTIYYLPDNEVEARDIQQILGIDMLVPDPNLHVNVEVVLVTEPHS